MPVTLAEEAEGQEPELNDPITTNGNSQVITAGESRPLQLVKHTV
jgi:hypothetical protein